MEVKTIYDLRLHEEIRVEYSLYVRRVAGGWLYTYYQSSSSTIMFVPFDDEFKKQN